MLKKIFVVAVLVAIVFASFYIKVLPYFLYGYVYAEGDGIKYSYYAAALSRSNQLFLPAEPPTAHPPILFHTANLLSAFVGEINAMGLVTSFFISLGSVGVFLFCPFCNKV